MILPNKILLFLVCCTIAVPCFGEACPVEGWVADYCNQAEECTCTIESITSCPYSLPNCNKLTIQVVALDEKPVCDDNNYVSYCDNTDLSLNNVLNVLTSSHYRFADKCWAVDGSLTTAQHYQNMRVVFNIGNTGGGYVDGSAYNYDNIDGIIDKMDTYSKKRDDATDNPGCKSDADVNCNYDTNNNRSKCVLAAWRKLVHNGCFASAQNPGGISCLKCPNNGKTPKPTVFVNKVKFTVTAITSGENNTPLQAPSSSDYEIVDSWWKSFNTIADCYIQGGTDERGTFNLGTDTDAKCYYSKE